MIIFKSLFVHVPKVLVRVVRGKYFSGNSLLYSIELCVLLDRKWKKFEKISHKDHKGTKITKKRLGGFSPKAMRGLSV